MLDQMQRIFSIDALPSSSPISSYAIGTIDPIQFVTLQAHLAIGEECSLLVPIHLPLSLFIDPWFKDGYESGYPEGELDEEWSVPRIVNWTYNVFNDELYDELTWETLGLHLPAWIVEWVLGSLAWLAETERTLALVGLAHLCFLLPRLALDSAMWPPRGLRHTDFFHRQALCAYRKRVRSYREQGRSFVQAQRLALATSA